MGEDEALFGGTVANNYREFLEPVIFRPWAELLVDFVAPLMGQSVLDVAAGTGVVSRAAAARIGPGGRVIASDVSAAMLAQVANDFPSREVALQTLECSATALDLPDASVDVVFCQQGLPFIPDRPGAAREMFRVLRPNGRVGIAVWLSTPRLEPFVIYGDALRAHRVLEPFQGAYDTSTLGMTTDELASTLVGAGFQDVEVRVERLEVAWPSVRHAVRAVSGTPYGPTIDAMDNDIRKSVIADVQRRMTGPRGTVATHVMTSILARGRRPSIDP
ncbi:MAG TPA: methyltransferase domain-containing protein [Acidimicrobiales bacterium]|nr:methyltransferase domain-containing protein [Acidimicrobiales bacterium]